MHTAIGFINGVSEIAEEANHHPDLHLTGYRYVTIDDSDVRVTFVALLSLRIESERRAARTEDGFQSCRDSSLLAYTP